MGESQVSVEGEPRNLADLFFVIATQNPVEFRGTYPLPEAQMDRFAMQFKLGYVQPAEEVAILTAQEHNHPLDGLKPCATLEDVLALKVPMSEIMVSQGEGGLEETLIREIELPPKTLVALPSLKPEEKTL